ncbi:uncharacterized protein MELLADRAFT_114276 [Melampsora larici-populina 98AG31]|uniref:Uncharacterized protein n=1 Tax=Melampsora larici-populina (strain 98AG31 / pathotype 3-4-7) TaxID=747676 RepID=F4SCW0_MELLP|nr:uncharacterized protein MELLADRAFT_114276 [Melampsora larici-populina 98AG31]EGF97521.1 hypothetical protein MELLADRAFT_114276 [Melampsora larici-populina 98AG31]
MDVANAPIRTAEQRNELLALPRTLAELEQKIQEVADEVGNNELLNVRRGTDNRLKAVVTVQVALGFLYEAKFGAEQQQVDAARRTKVVNTTKQYMEGSAAGDGDLILRWQQMVGRTADTWQAILGVPIFWAEEEDEQLEDEEEMDWCGDIFEYEYEYY